MSNFRPLGHGVTFRYSLPVLLPCGTFRAVGAWVGRFIPSLKGCQFGGLPFPARYGGRETRLPFLCRGGKSPPRFPSVG